MYKIILVDDEPIFTDYLSALVCWEAYGCSLCGIAADGQQAMALLQQHRPDIVFLDINIPIHDGLEVCGWLRENGFSTEVVMVSAHSDFHFAQKAIKYDVSDYLLKPFDKEEFLHTFRNCLQNVQMHRGQALRRCLATGGTLPGAEVIALMHKKDTPQALAQLAAEIDTQLRCAGVACWYYIDSAHITFACNAPGGLNRLCTLFEPYAAENAAIALGDKNPNLLQSLQHAQRALENRVLSPGNVLCYEALEQPAPGAVFSQSDIARLIGCLENHDEKGASARMARLFGLEGDHGISFQYFMSVFSSLALYMAQHYGKSRADAQRFLAQQSDILKELNDATDIADMRAIIENYIYELYSDCITIVPLTRRSELVEKINRYIAQNYAQKRFTVEKMAAELLFENSYMRRVYKTETGTTILKALEDHRMEKAKALLARRCYRHSEIAEMTGFGDPYYFSKRFKQIVGCTPSEFEVMTTNE